MANIQRIQHEVHDLTDSYTVKWSAEKLYVMLVRFDYPDGWEPGVSPLFFSLCPAYPEESPAVYLPPDMEYRGETVLHQLPADDDGWRQWCIDNIDWEPRHHGLRTMIAIMEQSLSAPYERRFIH